VTDNKCINNFINIANTCINFGFWPSHFKNLILIIIPNHNKLAYNLLKMFCPIVLLNIFRKLIEKVISKRIQVQSIANNFIYPNQLGGLKHCFAIDVDLYIIHLIHARWVKDLNTSTLAFNISHFFPSLNHQLLLMIFNKARFDKKISLFFSNYLINRKTQYI